MMPSDVAEISFSSLWSPCLHYYLSPLPEGGGLPLSIIPTDIHQSLSLSSKLSE